MLPLPFFDKNYSYHLLNELDSNAQLTMDKKFWNVKYSCTHVVYPAV